MRRRFFRRLVAAVALAGIATGAASQRSEITLDNKDLDTPYVPTPQKVVDAMLAMGKVTARDFLIDLGSGDGRIVITAAKQFGARGFGVELDPRLVQFANQVAREQGVADRAQFFEQDLFKTELNKASLITMYLLPDVNLELRSRLLQLAPGTRIVSHDYGMGDWTPDGHLVLDVPGKPVGPLAKSDIFMWVVPARVGGRWVGRTGDRLVQLDLDQTYQQIRGELRVGQERFALRPVKVDGRTLALATVDVTGVDLRLSASGESLQGVLNRRGEREDIVFNRAPVQ